MDTGDFFVDAVLAAMSNSCRKVAVALPAEPSSGAFEGLSDSPTDVGRKGDELQTVAGTALGVVSDAFPKVAGYQITARLGEGGMGVVWRAIQLSTKREVALKLMSAGVFASNRARHRFEREVEIAAEFQHPHIACIYDSGTDRGCYYYTMELIDGLPLDRYCDQNKLVQQQRLELMWAVCDAMQHAHERGVIHRDLKPSNILVDRTGAPHIVDFGLAKSSLTGESSISIDGDVLGTPAYMSPEQAEGKTAILDTRSDVYSLGVILYQLLTGKFPHDPRGSYLEVLQRIAQDEVAHPAELDRELQAILHKALSRDRAQRYASAGELARDIRNHLNGEVVSARHPTLFYFMGKAIRRRKTPIEVAAALILLLALGGYFLLQSNRHREVADLRGQFVQALDAGDWSPAGLQHLERIADELDRRSGNSREMGLRLNARLADSIRSRLSQPTVEESQMARLGEEIAWLRARDPGGAESVERMLQSRSRVWEELFSIKPPHANPPLIPGATVRGNCLVVASSGSDGILVREGCEGNVKLEAVCDIGGAANQEVGLVLFGRGKEGYFFKLNKAGMQIWRNGVVLRDVAAGWPGQGATAMRLEARREGNTLYFTVRGLPTLVFEDPYPIPSSRQAWFGLLARGTLAVHTLSAMRQTRPVVPSPLEAGDELLNGGLVSEARAEYEKQIAVLRDEDLQAVIYKIAACNQRTGNSAEAERSLKRLISEPGNRWPKMAGVQLWWLYVQQRRYLEADGVVESLLQRGASPTELSRQLASIIPREERYCGRGFNMLGDFSRYRMFTAELPEFLPALERSADMLVLLTDDREAARLQRLDLGKAYHRVGKMEQAARCFEALLNEYPTNHWAYVQVREEYGWAMRLSGRSADALGVVRKSAYEDVTSGRLSSDPQQLAVLVECARLSAALENWLEAEGSLNTFFDHVKREQANDRDWSSACLLRGCLRLRRGDEKGAQESWRAGVRRSNGTGITLLVDDGSTRNVCGPMNWSTQAALGGLTGQWDETDCRAFLAAMTRRLNAGAGTAYAAGFQMASQTPPTFLASMWRSRQGTQLARSLAFRDMNAAEWQRQFALNAIRELVIVEAIQRELTEDEEAALAPALVTLFDAVSRKQFSKQQLTALLTAWGDTPVLSRVMGWDYVAPTLSTEMRGPIAYAMGWRYLKLGKREQATQYFQVAARDAAAGSPLARAAGAALKELDDAAKGP